MYDSNSILSAMYRGTTTIQNFCWDAMRTVPLYYLVSQQDIDYIRKLILSPRYSGNNRLKTEKIDELMHFRGFTKFAGGTNRLVYTHPMAPNAVFKVAIDSVGINDNPAEYRNQYYLKPYCCKVFECSPCGTIASFEKVDRITNYDEFISIADDYFYILSRVIIGKYVMDDIGVDYFMNVGIRVGCHPVILDFPYLFELDGRKLECNTVLDNGSICHGEIDYDHGFNKLICKKCGTTYKARDLAKPPKDSHILIRDEGGCKMSLRIYRNGLLINDISSSNTEPFVSKNNSNIKHVNNSDDVVVRINNGNKPNSVDEACKMPSNECSNPKAKTRILKITLEESTGVVDTCSNDSCDIDVKIVRGDNCADESTPTQPIINNSSRVSVDDSRSPISKRLEEVSNNKSPTSNIQTETSGEDVNVTTSTDVQNEESVPNYDDDVDEESATDDNDYSDADDDLKKIIDEHPSLKETIFKVRFIGTTIKRDGLSDRKCIAKHLEYFNIEPNPGDIIGVVRGEDDESVFHYLFTDHWECLDVEPERDENWNLIYDPNKSEDVESDGENNKNLIEAISFGDPSEKVNATPYDVIKQMGYEGTKEDFINDLNGLCKASSRDDENEDFESDDEGEYVFKFVDKLPDDYELDVYYFVKKNSDTDASVYEGVTDPSQIDMSLFDVFIFINNEEETNGKTFMYKVSFNTEEKMWCLEEEYKQDSDGKFIKTDENFNEESADDSSDEEDKDIEELKNSSRKKDLDNM